MGSNEEPAPIAAAFPSGVGAVAERVAAAIPPSRFPAASPFTVHIDAEEIRIPYRIYNTEPDPAITVEWSVAEQLMLDCIYTRHHDGHVRERRVKRILGATDPWVVPFVVQLVGEYVVEIIEALNDGLRTLSDPDDPRRSSYARFEQENPAFMQLTAARVTSYWNCYYRARFPDRAQRPNRADYPGYQALDILRSVE